MSLIPLQLHIRAGNWFLFNHRRSARNYQKIKDFVHKRDASTCQYCGYVSSSNQIVNKNNNYKDNSQDNIVTACSICTQCVLLDGFGIDPAFGGMFIFLPEIQQVELNHLVRTVYAASEKQPTYKNQLSDLLISLEERKDEVEALFGKKSYEADIFSQGLMDSFVDEKKMQHPLIRNLRFLPDKGKLKGELQEFVKVYFALN